MTPTQTHRLCASYLLHFLQMTPTRAAMSRLATGTSSSMQNISQAKLKTLPVLVPPLDLQTRYSEIVASARVIATTAETASALSASLMVRLFGDAA